MCFPDVCATKSNIVGPVLLLTYAQYLLTFHDQDSKDVGLPLYIAYDNINNFTYYQMYFSMIQASSPWKINVPFYTMLLMSLSVCSVTLTFNMRDVSLSSLAGKPFF